MANHEICDTRLSLRTGLGNLVPKSDRAKGKRVLSSDLSFGQEQGQGSSSENAGEVNKRTKLSPEQISVLEGSFEEGPKLDTARKNALAAMLGLSTRQVEVWFQNRKARNKAKRTEMECEMWRQEYEILTEENRKLKKEIQRLKGMAVTDNAPFSADHLTNYLGFSVSPTCHRVEEVVPKGSTGGAAASANMVQNPKIKRRGVLKISG